MRKYFRSVGAVVLTLAGLAIAALAAVPGYAATSGTTTASVTINNVLSLSGLTAAFSLTGDPGTTQTALAAVSNPEPGPPTAADAIRAATIVGARTAGLGERVGALRPGMAADLFILDLTDPSFVPLNSVARQVVFTEGGRGVETVIVDGRVVIADRKITTIDERALREEVAGLMKILRKDIEAVTKRNGAMLPYLLEAQRKTWEVDIGLNRYVGNADD